MPIWLYRILLRAYPRGFRARYERDLLEGFEYLADEARRRGLPRWLAFGVRTAWDTLRSGVRERASTRGYRLGTSGVRFPGSGLSTLLADALIDVRYAARTLRATPGYLVGVAVTLALGVGANTALFSAAWGVFGRPLPFDDANELVRVEAFRPSWEEGMSGGRDLTFSVAELGDLRSVGAFEDVAEYHRMSFTLIGPAGPDLVQAAVVSSNYFDFLGMRPMLGRLFAPVEDHLGARPVIVLSYEYWTSSFASDPDVVGRTVRMNGSEHEIVGVLPRIPQFPEQNHIYLPISVCPTRSSPTFIENRDRRMMSAYARLDDRAGLEGAREELDHARSRMHGEHAGYADIPGGHDLSLTPLREELVREARPVLTPLIGVALLLLLIACANAAGLALSRANRRMGSLVVRSAMGAGRGRIARQLLTESVLVAVLGWALGLAVAVVGSDLLATFAAGFTTRAQEIRVDGVVLAFSLGAAVVTGLAFGLAPVLTTSRLSERLLRSGGATAGLRSGRLQRGLVAVQVMFAFAVLSSAGLLLRSFWNANSTAVGFETESVITAEFTGSQDRYSGNVAFRKMLDAARERLRADARFTAVARTQWAPLADPHAHRDGYYLGTGTSEWVAAVADGRAVDPEYFDVLGIDVVRGRGLNAADTLGAEQVVVVNETFYSTYMEGTADVGDLAAPCPPEDRCGEPLRIVGVVRDARVNGAEFDVVPRLFAPLDQTDWFSNVLVARVVGDPQIAITEMVAVVHAIDPELAVRHSGSLEHFRREALTPRRFMASLLIMFAAVATGLALAGVFGVTALAASARTRELAIRRSLGATEQEAERLVVRDGLVVVAVGWVGGLVLTWWIGPALEGVLFDVEPWDPLTLAGVGALFLAAAAVACLVPARRATRVEVVTTLNHS